MAQFIVFPDQIHVRVDSETWLVEVAVERASFGDYAKLPTAPLDVGFEFGDEGWIPGFLKMMEKKS